MNTSNVIVKNKKSGVNQLLTPSGLKSILGNHKTKDQIDIMGFADEQGRLILNTKKDAEKIYRPLILKAVPQTVKPIEELQPNKDMGKDAKEELM